MVLLLLLNSSTVLRSGNSSNHLINEATYIFSTVRTSFLDKSFPPNYW